MILIPDESLWRLGVHILSTEYLEDGAFSFIAVTEHDNISFDHEVVEDEDGKENGK